MGFLAGEFYIYFSYFLAHPISTHKHLILPPQRNPILTIAQFNGGPRICIGQQFALTEASYVIVRLLQRFDVVENQDFSSKALHNLTLTSCSGTGVVVKLHAAEE